MSFSPETEKKLRAAGYSWGQIKKWKDLQVGDETIQNFLKLRKAVPCIVNPEEEK